ncbi:hypothetical protein PANA5342_pPANA10045 (plasmid) [Pantoea ananatis LMG 5342]|nr:hypothetical protein PANA5342_pPANA10045 [Pantoea ananatis LMG 5342]
MRSGFRSGRRVVVLLRQSACLTLHLTHGAAK